MFCFLSRRRCVDWRTVTGGCPLPWDVSSWGVSPLHRPSPSLAGRGGATTKQVVEPQVSNGEEPLMVCFLFPVGPWRRIVLKLAANRKFQSRVRPALLHPSQLPLTPVIITVVILLVAVSGSRRRGVKAVWIAGQGPVLFLLGGRGRRPLHPQLCCAKGFLMPPPGSRTQGGKDALNTVQP